MHAPQYKSNASAAHAGALKTPLDLGSLSPEPDSGASELSQRQAELKRFQLRCSEVAPGIFVSGEQVAATKSILHRHGVTHVVNCISNIFHSRFPDDFTYLELALKGERAPLACKTSKAIAIG